MGGWLIVLFFGITKQPSRFATGCNPRAFFIHLDDLRRDSAIQQKKGVHFILASVIIWSAVLVVHLTDLLILTKNLLTFMFTAPLIRWRS